MAVSIKQLLVSILFVGFAISALLNHERAYMLEFVKLAVFGTLVAMAYGIWATADEDRAFCTGFLLWGGLYYLLFVVIQTDRVDLGTEMLLMRLGRQLDLTSPRLHVGVVRENGPPIDFARVRRDWQLGDGVFLPQTAADARAASTTIDCGEQQPPIPLPRLRWKPSHHLADYLPSPCSCRRWWPGRTNCYLN